MCPLKADLFYSFRPQVPCAELPRPDIHTSKLTVHCTHCLFHFAAIKPRLKQQLKNEEVEVGGTAKLRCEISISKAEVEWSKDGAVLHSSSKYEMWQQGTIRELRVHHLEPGDAGEYSCKAGDETTSAKLTVKGKRYLLEPRGFSL